MADASQGFSPEAIGADRSQILKGLELRRRKPLAKNR